MNELVKTGTGDVLNIIDAASRNPDLNPEVMEKLLNMQITVLDREAKQEFNRAFIECQASMPAIIRDTPNEQTRSTYAKLETINKHLIPHYTGHGFGMSYGTADSPLENHVRVTAELMHRGGHSKMYFYDSPHDAAGIKGVVNKTPAHARASALTYGERYLATIIFNIIVTTDDDGNAANTALYTEDQWIQFQDCISEDSPQPLAFAAIDYAWKDAMGPMRSRHLEAFKATKGITKESNRLKMLVKQGHEDADVIALTIEQHVDGEDFAAVEQIFDEMDRNEKTIVWAHVKPGYRTDLERYRNDQKMNGVAA